MAYYELTIWAQNIKAVKATTRTEGCPSRDEHPPSGSLRGCSSLWITERWTPLTKPCMLCSHPRLWCGLQRPPATRRSGGGWKDRNGFVSFATHYMQSIIHKAYGASLRLRGHTRDRINPKVPQPCAAINHSLVSPQNTPLESVLILQHHRN